MLCIFIGDNMEETDKTLVDFLLEAKKKAEDANPAIKKIVDLDPTLYQPIYGYVITYSSN